VTTERLFFALWPDAATRATLAQRVPQWTTGLDGRLQRPDQWHVTLEFIGAVETQRRAALIAAADRVRLPVCELAFDRCEHWRKARVVCLVASVTPEPLARFVARLRAALATVGVEPEARPYQPHVTLARKVRTATDVPVTPALVWPATGFALVRSSSDPAGSRYEPLHWWNGVSRGGRETRDSR
jgi:RNA 2',3'-cyclic 3'-phosphodiesterase